MAAAYDTYDYPSYWEGREYEHNAEVLAIRHLLAKIPKITKVLEIGAGYGRLVPLYLYRANKIILTDPSARLLKHAKSTYKLKKIKTLQTKAENLPPKIKSKSVDLIIIVRVLHHVESVDNIFKISHRTLKKNGYLIIEFANKKHLKAALSEVLKGNLTFPLDIFPKDRRSEKSIKEHDLPFLNYHPDIIIDKLKQQGFRIVETRSVSNLRSSFIKRILPLDILLFIEDILQTALSYINLGPSIFILAKKVG